MIGISSSTMNSCNHKIKLLTYAIPLEASTTEMLESCPTQANFVPLAEKHTECTQPPKYENKMS